MMRMEWRSVLFGNEGYLTDDQKYTTKRADWQNHCTSSDFGVYWAVQTAAHQISGSAGRQAYRRVYAWVLSKENSRYASIIASRKQALLGALEGTVVELGPGGGHNLRFYPPTIHWIGIEPNPYAHEYLRARAEASGISAEFLTGQGENIPLPDSTADAVVGTLVLCSVSSPKRVLAEILRVLKPGGTYAFIEHVAAPAETGMRAVQRLIRPVWKLATDGCNPDRETWRDIEEAGFGELAIEHFKVSIAITAPHIAGSGKKPYPTFPLFCDFSCPHAEFAPGDTVGACRREQAVYCAFFRRLNNKNSFCLNRKQAAIFPHSTR